MTVRLVVLASGNGTNLRAVIDACDRGSIEGSVVAVVSDRAGSRALSHAAERGIAAVPLVRLASESRAGYDARLADTVAMFAPHWVVLAGWMRVLSMSFLGRFPRRVINLHPALPGQFPGIHAIERAHAAALEGQLDRTGVMVHLVPDEGVDDGPVLATRDVAIHAGESLEELEQRMHLVEHEVLVSVLATLCATRLRTA